MTIVTVVLHWCVLCMTREYFCLQQACGFEYTSKLQRMFQDVGVSKDLNENFKRHLQQFVDADNDKSGCCLLCTSSTKHLVRSVKL